jgi:hypothetical protein
VYSFSPQNSEEKSALKNCEIEIFFQKMALVGTATYAVEFVRAREKVLRSMGGGIELVHGIPILLNGTEDSALIRSWVDLEH